MRKKRTRSFYSAKDERDTLKNVSENDDKNKFSLFN